MRLSELLRFDDIVIQCHDNPDADTLASAYGVYYYLKKMGKNPAIFYSGRYKIKKSNLKLLIKEIGIPVEYVSARKAYNINSELLITVDCQYGEGNVSPILAKNVAVIDHHLMTQSKYPPLTEIVQGLGSCSTLVYEMLKREGIDINENEKLATALYYGLLTDTNNFSEVYHPLDRDLMDGAKVHALLIRMFRNANMSLEELQIAGDALTNAEYIKSGQYAIVKTRPCDPNILGLISDMVLEVDAINSCIVYTDNDFGTKISVRSCIREVSASELAKYITRNVGNGGGHIDKAGGFIKLSGKKAEKLIKLRYETYFANTEIIDVENYKADVSGYRKCVKKKIANGFVKGLDVAKENAKVIVRTLEGDQVVNIEKDTYIMIGLAGEIHPIKEDTFLDSYRILEGEYVCNFEYDPELIDNTDGTRINLVKHARRCISTGESKVFVKELDHRVKIFTEWDRDRYYLGNPGDFIAVRENNMKDVFIISREIFPLTYKYV